MTCFSVYSTKYVWSPWVTSSIELFLESGGVIIGCFMYGSMCTGDVVPRRRYIISITEITVAPKASRQPTSSRINGSMLTPVSGKTNAYRPATGLCVYAASSRVIKKTIPRCASGSFIRRNVHCSLCTEDQSQLIAAR